MKTSLPWFLFALSGAFNAFFVVGVATRHWGPFGRPGPEARADFFARELDLDEVQRRAFVEVETEFLSDRQRRSASHRGNLDRVLAELVKEEPDEAVLKAFVEGEEGMNPRKGFVEHLRAIMKILRPEQRAKAAELFRGGFGRGRGMGLGGPPGRGPGGGGGCGGPPGHGG